MKEKAVVDPFEEDKAVLLVGEEGRQLIVDRRLLPAETKEGHWLKAELEGRVLARAEIDQAETDAAKARIASKLDELRRGEYLKDEWGDGQGHLSGEI